MVREHRQEGLPRSDLRAELLGHDPGDLRDVLEVVHDPGGRATHPAFA